VTRPCTIYGSGCSVLQDCVTLNICWSKSCKLLLGCGHSINDIQGFTTSPDRDSRKCTRYPALNHGNHTFCPPGKHLDGVCKRVGCQLLRINLRYRTHDLLSGRLPIAHNNHFTQRLEILGQSDVNDLSTVHRNLLGDIPYKRKYQHRIRFRNVNTIRPVDFRYLPGSTPFQNDVHPRERLPTFIAHLPCHRMLGDQPRRKEPGQHTDPETQHLEFE